MSKVVERLEDMSRIGRLRLIKQDDGDIIVAVQSEQDGVLQSGDSVEFCTSGGRSPNTLKALNELIKAMALDNESHTHGCVKNVR